MAPKAETPWREGKDSALKAVRAGRWAVMSIITFRGQPTQPILAASHIVRALTDVWPGEVDSPEKIAGITVSDLLSGASLEPASFWWALGLCSCDSAQG